MDNPEGPSNSEYDGKRPMTKKHYTMVAKVLANLEKIDAVEKRVLVARLCGAFSGDNPKFNAETFTDACYA